MTKLTDDQIRGLCQQVISLQDDLLVANEKLQIAEGTLKIMELSLHNSAASLKEFVEGKRFRDMLQMVEDLRGEISEQAPYVLFYKKLQEAILKNESLMEEWQKLCFMLKMVDPDIHKYTSHPTD